MKQHNMKPIYKIILCIIVSLVIEGLYLYIQFWYLICYDCNNTFFKLFAIPNEVVGIILFFFIAFVAGIVTALAAKLLKLLRREKIIFIILNSFVIIGFVVWWLWECYLY